MRQNDVEILRKLRERLLRNAGYQEGLGKYDIAIALKGEALAVRRAIDALNG